MAEASSCHNLMAVFAPALLLLCLVLQAGAAEKGVPLYKYIAQLAGNAKLVNRE